MVVQAGFSQVLCFRILPGEVSSWAQLRKHLFLSLLGLLEEFVSLWFYDPKPCFLLTSSWRPPLGVRGLLQFLCYMYILNMAANFIETIRRPCPQGRLCPCFKGFQLIEPGSLKKIYFHLIHNQLIWGLTCTITFSIFCWLNASHRSYPHPRRGDYTGLEHLRV